MRAIGERLRGVRYVAEDLSFAVVRSLSGVGRKIAGVGRGIADAWRRVPVVARRRIAAGVAAVALVALVAFVLIPRLPCEAPGGDECAPADDAIALVPADARVYVHGNIDEETDQGRRARALVSTLPQLSRQGIGQLLPLLVGTAGQPSDFARDIEPWFGGEFGVAVAADGKRTQQVQLLEAADLDGALAYAEQIAAGVPRASEHQGVEVSEDERGLATALVDGFLVLGTVQGVRATIDVATGAEEAQSLESDATADEALAALPDLRTAEAYVSADGVEAYVADPRGPLAAFEPLVDSGASQGVALSVSAEEDGISLASRSVLDPERSKAAPGFFSAFDSFEADLPSRMSVDTLAYVDLGQADETIKSLLDQATVRAPGIAAGFTDLFKGLRKVAGVDLEKDLLAALGRESALALVSRPVAEREEPQGGLPGVEPPETVNPEALRTPYLEFLADGVDADAALEAMARLQGPIGETVDPELGAPNFTAKQIGDLEAQVLKVSPASTFAYAVRDSLLLVGNDLAGVERLAAGAGDDESLAGAEAYEAAFDDMPSEAGLFAYFDLAGLLEFAERTTLAQDPSYSAFADDLARLRTLAIAIASESETLAADVRLRIE